MEFRFYVLLITKIFQVIGQAIARLFQTKKLKNVRGQLALITGGANGIGKNIALRLAAHGCNIAIVDVDMVSAKQTVSEIEYFNVKARAFHADIGKLEDVERLKVDIEKELGPVDILINNAGIHLARHVTEETPERLHQMLNTNLISNLWTVRVFLPGMIQRKRGHIAAVSSAAGLYGMPEGITYSTTKFGVRGFMESLLLQLHVDGHGEYIKTTTIFPYFVNTRPLIVNVVNKGLNLKLLFTPDQCGKASVDGMLKDQETVFIPGYIYYLLYLITAPLPLKKAIFSTIVKKGFRTYHAEEEDQTKYDKPVAA